MSLRLHILSDLHVDYPNNNWTPEPVDADVIVCAGDTMSPATLALPWMREAFPDQEIIYAPGNHDYYSHFDKKNPGAGTKTTWEQQHERAPIIAKMLGIHYLDDSSVVVGDTRFVGGTLWTDFSARPDYLMFGDAAREASKRMNDYRLIKVEPGASRHRLTTRHTQDAHARTVQFLEQSLCQPFDGDTVMVTHHAPVPNSLIGWDPERPRVFRELDWCYANRSLNRLFTGEGLGPDFVAPVLAIHGHIHATCDYMIHNTRVITNARGRPENTWNKNAKRENPHFIPNLVVELEPRLIAKCGL